MTYRAIPRPDRQICLCFQSGEREVDLADLGAETMNAPHEVPSPPQPDSPTTASDTPLPVEATRPREIGGREGPEPTRFGDWEKAGRCIDF